MLSAADHLTDYCTKTKLSSPVWVKLDFFFFSQKKYFLVFPQMYSGSSAWTLFDLWSSDEKMVLLIAAVTISSCCTGVRSQWTQTTKIQSEAIKILRAGHTETLILKCLSLSPELSLGHAGLFESDKAGLQQFARGWWVMVTAPRLWSGQPCSGPAPEVVHLGCS